MHSYELLACLALVSGAFVCAVAHPFLEVPGIHQEFGFGSRVQTMVIHSGPLSSWGYGLAPFRLGIWTPESESEPPEFSLCKCEPCQREIYQQEFRTAHLNFWNEDKPKHEAIQHCGGG